MVDRYVAAFERANVPASPRCWPMTSYSRCRRCGNWYVGADAYAALMFRVFRLRGDVWRTVPLWANGEAGFAAYVAGALHSVQIFTVTRGRVTRTTVYQDENVFNLFSLER